MLSDGSDNVSREKLTDGSETIKGDCQLGVTDYHGISCQMGVANYEGKLPAGIDRIFWERLLDGSDKLYQEAVRWE